MTATNDDRDHGRMLGASGEEEQWSLCVADTGSVLSFAVGAMFVREEFDGNSKHSASNRDGTGSHFVTQRPSDPGIQRPGDPVDPATLFYNELQMSTYV